MCLMQTDLPVPDGPRIIEIWPSGRPRLRPFRIVLRPKDFFTSMNSTASVSALSLRRGALGVPAVLVVLAAARLGAAGARWSRAWSRRAPAARPRGVARRRSADGLLLRRRVALRRSAWPAAAARAGRVGRDGGVAPTRRGLVARALPGLRRLVVGHAGSPPAACPAAPCACASRRPCCARQPSRRSFLAAYWRSRVSAPEDLSPEHPHEVDHHGVDHHRLRRRGADSHRAAAGRVAVVAARRGR